MAKTQKKSNITKPDKSQPLGGDEQKTEPSIVKSADSSPSPNKKPLYVFIGIALIVSLLAWLLVAQPFARPVAEVNGHLIYRQDTKKMTSKNKKINTKDAAIVLADKYLVEAIAEQQNVEVSQADLEQEFGKQINDQKESDPYTYQANINSLYFKKLGALNAGAYKGEYVVAHFSRNIAYDSPLLAEQKRFMPTIGNQAAIAADRAYAEKFINDLHTKVSSGKITFDQAMQAERKDSYLGEGAYGTLSHSRAFDTTLAQDSVLNTKSILKTINEIKPGTVTKPFVVKVPNSDKDDSKVDSFFLMVKMDSSKGGNTGKTFDEQLKQKKQELGYKINV